MAYGEKYHVIYCDRNGKQFRLGIHEWDYSGPSVRHKAAPSPFTVTQETSSELKLGGIYPTRATATLVSSKTFNMEELYTADERKYLVTHEPTDGSDQGKWYGNIIPNGFTEEMDNDVHYMVLTASDNLPTLKLKLFEEAPGLNYGIESGNFIESFLWVAKEAFKKTDLLLPIWTMVDIMPRLNSSSLVLSRYVRALSPSTVEFADDSGEVTDMIEQGSRIDVEWDNGDIDSFTADSWTGYDLWPNWMISITVDEAVSTRLGNAKVTVSNPVDIATLPDPLAITVHDLRTYIRDQDIEGKNYFEVSGGALSTWDVLNNLARQWNAKIYQNNGRWEIVRWNAFARASNGYQYFVYNAEGVQTGRQPFGNVVNYPCKSTRTRFRPFGHPISMDRVLGAVGVNYIYKFKTDGDSLVNLIQNGNFASIIEPGAPPPNTNPISFTPARWVRKSELPPGAIASMLIFQHLQPPAGQVFPPGVSTFISLGGFYHIRNWLSSGSGYPADVSQGDQLRVSWWQRVPVQLVSPIPTYGYSVIRVVIQDQNGILLYSLVNDGMTDNNTGSVISNFNNHVAKWVPYDNAGTFPAFVSRFPATGTDDGLSDWGKVSISTPPCPASGRVVVAIIGVGAATANQQEPNIQPNTFPTYMPSLPSQGQGSLTLQNWRFVSSPLHLSGVFVGKIVDLSSEKIQQIHPYWYENDGAYTDSIDDIEVLTGDDNNPDHVSNIYVMDGVTRRAIKQWDTWANDFGWSALGLVLAKSVMQQYYRPWRVIDGSFVTERWHWSNLVTFEERPGELYAMLRGTVSHKDNQFTGTLAQVYDANTPALPPGGHDGGNTIDPIWQATGTTRCTRDENGENTGHVESLEVDMNPASPTYRQNRWVDVGEDTGSCPIGEPVNFFWGASPLPIDVNELSYYPVISSGDEHTVQFDNDGSGKYLVFLWRRSLGVVQSILDVEMEETISSWVVESDVTINGYAYGVMRMAYMTGVFTGLDKTFKIN